MEKTPKMVPEGALLHPVDPCADCKHELSRVEGQLKIAKSQLNVLTEKCRRQEKILSQIAGLLHNYNPDTPPEFRIKDDDPHEVLRILALAIARIPENIASPYTIEGMPTELAEELMDYLVRSLTGKERIAGPSITDVDN
jgi:hypothetical protein